ncbi:MAG: hypothetical protein IT374_22495 [Polyangiaceae bacterium]|nr:hypothetical protein [Polyangiaceae bacterium]
MSELGRALAARIDDPVRAAYYLEVGEFCLGVVDRSASHPVIIGINGPQGCGKSSLARHLVDALDVIGVRAVDLSIDDFYLRRDAQLELAARHPRDRTLEHRGYPGTHDVELGRRTLAALADGRRTLAPVYDKSAHAGRGDRAPVTAWRMIEPPLDLVILEGWMLGFEPLAEDRVPGELRAPNALLGAYDAWTSLLDGRVALSPASIDDIVTWRVDAERARRARGEPALSDDDARDYVERFLPAYRAYLPGLARARAGSPSLTLTIGLDRAPVPR